MPDLIKSNDLLGGGTYIFDERSTERQIGWYINSQGQKKPIYEQSVPFTVSSISGRTWVTIETLTSWNIDACVEITGYSMIDNVAVRNVTTNDAVVSFVPMYYTSDKTLQVVYNTAANGPVSGYIVLRYTKTTDTFA